MTSGGWRRMRRFLARSIMAPPPCRRRSVRRRSTRQPRASGWKRRVGTVRIGSRMARISARACAISSADMSSKSCAAGTSLAEKVSVASSRSSPRHPRAPRPRRVLFEVPAPRRDAVPPPGARRGFGLDLRQEQLHRLLEQIGLAPEDVERLVEQLALVAAVGENGVQGPVEVAAAADADRLDRAQRILLLPGPTGMPAARNARAKCMMFTAKRRTSKRLRSAGRAGAASVMGYFDHVATGQITCQNPDLLPSRPAATVANPAHGRSRRCGSSARAPVQWRPARRKCAIIRRTTAGCAGSQPSGPRRVRPCLPCLKR